MHIKFAENLKNLRLEKSLLQKELANILGVTQQCISGWELEKAEPTLTYLWKLADAFDISIDTLCGRREW